MGVQHVSRNAALTLLVWTKATNTGALGNKHADNLAKAVR